MRAQLIPMILIAVGFTSSPSFAQKLIGKCMRADCASISTAKRVGAQERRERIELPLEASAFRAKAADG